MFRMADACCTPTNRDIGCCHDYYIICQDLPQKKDKVLLETTFSSPQFLTGYLSERNLTFGN